MAVCCGIGRSRRGTGSISGPSRQHAQSGWFAMVKMTPANQEPTCEREEMANLGLERAHQERRIRSVALESGKEVEGRLTRKIEEGIL